MAANMTKNVHISRWNRKISAIKQQITHGERDIGVKLHSIVTQSSLKAQPPRSGLIVVHIYVR